MKKDKLRAHVISDFVYSHVFEDFLVNTFGEVSRSPSATAASLNGRADALFCGWSTSVDARLLQSMPNLKYLGLRCSSLANVDVEYLAAHGVLVRTLSAYGDQGTIEFIVEQALASTRRSRTAGFSRRELGGKMFGVLGFGSVAKLLVPVLTAFGAKVLIHTPRGEASAGGAVPPNAEFVSKQTLLSRSDYLSINTPAHTVVLAASDFELMKPDVCILATTLGLPFVQSDLTRFLEANPDASCAMDLCSAQGAVEPLNRENLTIHEYYAARTQESIARADRQLIENFMKSGVSNE